MVISHRFPEMENLAPFALRFRQEMPEEDPCSMNTRENRAEGKPDRLGRLPALHVLKEDHQERELVAILQRVEGVLKRLLARKKARRWLRGQIGQLFR